MSTGTIIGLLICSAAALTVSAVKGFIPAMRYRRELYDQKIIFMRFLKIIRTLSGCYAQKKYLMKVAHPEDNMYRVVQKHIFIYRGGLAEFDEKIREHEERCLQCNAKR
jgi:hypothetical protein